MAAEVLPDPAGTSTPAARPSDISGLDSTSGVSASLTGAELRELRHEVVNALTAASGYTQFPLRKLPSWADEHDPRALHGIADGVARACEVLEHTRRDGPTSACLCDLTGLLEAAAQDVPSERWADIRVCVGREPLIGRWDAGRLAQLLTNLLLNAAQYSPAGTPIEVEATASERRTGRASSSATTASASKTTRWRPSSTGAVRRGRSKLRPDPESACASAAGWSKPKAGCCGR